MKNAIRIMTTEDEAVNAIADEIVLEKAILVVTENQKIEELLFRLLLSFGITIREIGIDFVTTRELLAKDYRDFDVVFVAPEVKTTGYVWSKVKDQLELCVGEGA